MNWGYRCDVTGFPDSCGQEGVNPCPHCHGRHEAYEVGAPPMREGCGTTIGDELRPYFDWSAGCKISSKSERRRIYAEKGMQEKSLAEHYRNNPTPGPKPGRAVSYAGQGNHKSTAERHAVVTKTGKRVI